MIKTPLSLSLGLLSLVSLFGQAPRPEQKIIPLPAQISSAEAENGGVFILSPEVSLLCLDKSLEEKSSQLHETLSQGLGFALSPSKTNSTITIKKGDKDLAPLGIEAYKLSITPQSITIEVNDPKGVFYAGQTLAQLLPVDFFQKEKTTKSWTLPCTVITDYPRFAWRSLMMDEGRYFFGEKTICRILDQMALMKMNTFHWHLTDDAGWRIEIKKYPKLTSIGSKRTDSEIGTWGSNKLAGEPHSGFYTQEEIKRIVKYAADRNITIIPEIAMPGHASAIAAAYPEFSTTKEKITMPIKFGKLPTALDASNEATYAFLSDVLDEVVTLFPSKIIHIGGDEVRFQQWNDSPAIKKFAKEQGFKNTNTDVQVYFTNRMNEIISKKNCRTIGWNEIMGVSLHGEKAEASEKKLSPDTIIHFWKGSADLAKKAIEDGHEVINSTHSSTYLDYSYGSISLAKAYNFDPIFEGLAPEFHSKVIGTGCQMWTEWVSNQDKLEYQIFPRACAFAEGAWTPKDRKDFVSFKARMKEHGQRMDAAGIKYAKNLPEELTEADFFNTPKLGTWNPDSLKNKKSTWDAGKVITSPGKYKISFLYTKGASALSIKSASLTDASGKVWATDTHPGHSGARKSQIDYTLELKELPSQPLSLSADIAGDGNNDSHGTIYIEKL